MNILLFLIPITLVLGICGLLAFLWTVKNKQYDDLEGSAKRILFEDKTEK
jgi:cbb3-type cytochrome oxidase maturation protein